MIESADTNRMPAASRPRLDERALSWVLGLVGVISALSIWVLLSRLLVGGGGGVNTLPPPALVAQKLLVYAEDDLGHDLVSSLKVFLIGWLAAVICATVVGILLGR